jgi:hypothetical protein
LRGETALRRGVDDEDDFAVELGERVFGAALYVGLAGCNGRAGRFVGRPRSEGRC